MTTNAKTFERAINSVFPRDLSAACRVIRELGYRATAAGNSGGAFEFEDGSMATLQWHGSMRGYWLAEG